MADARRQEISTSRPAVDSAEIYRLCTAADILADITNALVTEHRMALPTAEAFAAAYSNSDAATKKALIGALREDQRQTVRRVAGEYIWETQNFQWNETMRQMCGFVMQWPLRAFHSLQLRARRLGR